MRRRYENYFNKYYQQKLLNKQKFKQPQSPLIKATVELQEELKLIRRNQLTNGPQLIKPYDKSEYNFIPYYFNTTSPLNTVRIKNVDLKYPENRVRLLVPEAQALDF